MGNLISKNTESTTKWQKQRDLTNYRPGFELKLTKKLNPLAYLVIGALYTAGVIFTTSFFLDSGQNPRRGFSYSEQKIKEEILKEIRSMQSAPAVIVKESYNKELDRHLEKFRYELIDEVNKMNLKYADMIKGSTLETNKVLHEALDRKSASLNISGGETLSYNEVNKKVLRFKHQKEYKRAKFTLNKKRESLIQSLNLQNPEDVEKLKDFEDSMELSLYELKQKQNAIQKKFRKNKFMVVNN